jgi:hypothetical protein
LISFSFHEGLNQQASALLLSHTSSPLPIISVGEEVGRKVGSLDRQILENGKELSVLGPFPFLFSLYGSCLGLAGRGPGFFPKAPT